MTSRVAACTAALLVILGCTVGCGRSDPKAKILDARTRWNVDLLSWAVSPDGSLRAEVRIAGPVRSEIDTLTVRFEFADAEGSVFHQEWRSLDLTRSQRGAPFNVTLSFEPTSQPTEALGVSTVPDPTPEEARHIVELSSAD